MNPWREAGSQEGGVPRGTRGNSGSLFQAGRGRPEGKALIQQFVEIQVKRYTFARKSLRLRRAIRAASWRDQGLGVGAPMGVVGIAESTGRGGPCPRRARALRAFRAESAAE